MFPASFPTNADIVELTDWRRKLHQMPELSGQEAQTAAEVRAFLAATGPDQIIDGLGGHGVAVVYEGSKPGPTVMLRAELDALPIEEGRLTPHRSAIPGRAHLCGHEGHMAALAMVGRGLGRQRPQRGRAVLMFQPAEEDGSGSAAVIADPRFAALRPDLSLSWHNMPGIPRGFAAIVEGPVNCASRGMRITLTGSTAHASLPECGRSPAAAVARLIPRLETLGSGSTKDESFAMATLTHVQVGERSFGIAPGYAEVWVTLRTLTNARMDQLCREAEAITRWEATGLGVAFAYGAVFDASVNDPAAVAQLRQALDDEGIAHGPGPLPLRPSEDFGRFGELAPSAMVFLGAGEDHPHLHTPDYDFPDELIGTGARVMLRAVRNVLG